MIRINNFEIYCMLVLLTVPSAFLIVPAMVNHRTANNAWLAILAALIPGALLLYVYLYILKKSTRPFPLMLEDCLGKIIGKILGFFYIIVFLIGCSVNLAIFVTFISANIVPDTPLSVFIGLMLLTCYYGLKTGLANIARVSILMFLLALPLIILLLSLGIAYNPDFSNLLPFMSISLQDFAHGVYEGFWIISNMMAILILAFFSTRREKISSTLFMSLFTYVFITAMSAAVIIIHIGSNTTNLLSFPIFKVVRDISVGDFIQNVDALFIALWIAGVFGAISVKWFMACYVTQQVFGLKDYKFIAAPTAVIIAFFTLLAAKNIIALHVLVHTLLPVIYGVIYVLIPLLIFFVMLFKPDPGADADTGLKTPAA